MTRQKKLPTMEEFQKRVAVIITPEGEYEALGPNLLSPEATFRLSTRGMDYYGRPELEMTAVPAPWALSAFQLLNSWAYYSVRKPIFGGETIGEGLPFSAIWRAHGRPGSTALLLVPEAVHFQCCACGCAEG